MAEATLEKVVAERPEVALPAAGPIRVRWYRRLLRNRNVMVGASLFLLLLLAAIFAGVLATHSPTRLYPANRLKAPSGANRLGTDEFGRDVYSLILFGARTSLRIGGLTMLFTSIGGIVIGLIAGYYRRL